MVGSPSDRWPSPSPPETGDGLCAGSFYLRDLVGTASDGDRGQRGPCPSKWPSCLCALGVLGSWFPGKGNPSHVGKMGEPVWGFPLSTHK